MKSVELQIAVPRTQEAGKIQNEFQQKSTQEQTFLANQQIKESRELRQRSPGVDETVNSSIREEGKQQHSSQQNGQSQSSQLEQQPEKHPAEHPFKGHHIDLSL
jgi:hypothetical protein